MIFDSVYDSYRGVVTYVRVVDGHAQQARAHPDDVHRRHPRAAGDRRLNSPEMTAADGLGVGEVGYLITGVKDVRQSKVGDTITTPSARARPRPLGGYKDPKPMVFSGLYPLDGSDYPELRDALDKLQLNDAALVYEPETSAALGFGFRVGFLGLLHLEVIRERLEREFGLDLIATAPNVVYRVDDGGRHRAHGHQPERVPRGQDRRGARAGRAGHDPGARASSSARSWSCARTAAARCSAWTTSPRTGSRSATRCRSPRSSSTSSTS